MMSKRVEVTKNGSFLKKEDKDKVLRELNNKLMEMQNEYLDDMVIVEDLLNVCMLFINKWKKRREIEL